MSAISYLEALAKKRTEHLNALAMLPDDQTSKHSRIKGQIVGLDEAATIFKENLKSDDEAGS